MADNNFVIITGMSGAGKSQAANIFEDMGYFCIDNIPPQLITSLITLSSRYGTKLEKIALTVDLRGGEMFNNTIEILQQLKSQGINPCIVYLDANNTELIRRYTENRRVHPLTAIMQLSLEEAVEKEREYLLDIHSIANFIIDTTHFSNKQLKQRITTVFANNSINTFKIHCMSFGYKYGVPSDTDLMFDARCLPNPYYIEEISALSGKDKGIQDYFLKYPQVEEFINKITDFVKFSLPFYQNEGKSALTIAVGCTGGRHRSVYCAEQLKQALSKLNCSTSIDHRDIDK